MAIIQQQNDPNNQQNQQKSSAPASSGPQSMTMPSPMNAPSQVNQSDQSTKPSASSGKFTNVQSFLGANQGAGNRMATNVSSNVSDKAASIRQGVQQAQTNFQQQATPEQQRLQQGQTLVSNAMNNAQEFVKDPNQLQQFSQLRQGQVAQLQNPQDALAQQQQQAQELQKTVQSGNTEEGRFGLLKQAFQGPTYGKGAQRLDQLLLERDTQAPGQNMLQQKLQAAYGNVDKDVSNELTGEQQQIKSIQDLAKQRQDEINQGLGDIDKGGLIGGLASDLNKRIQAQNALYSKDSVGDLQSRLAAISAGKDKYTDASGQEKDVSLTQDELDRMGLKADQSIYNTNVSDYLNNAAIGRQFSKEEVANQDDYSKYNALQQLAGRDIGLLGQKSTIAAPSLLNSSDLVASAQAAKQKQDDEWARQHDQFTKFANQKVLDQNVGGDLGPQNFAATRQQLEDLRNNFFVDKNNPGQLDFSRATAQNQDYMNAIRALGSQYAAPQADQLEHLAFTASQELANARNADKQQAQAEADYQNKFKNATLQRYLRGNNGTPTV